MYYPMVKFYGVNDYSMVNFGTIPQFYQQITACQSIVYWKILFPI